MKTIFGTLLMLSSLWATCYALGQMPLGLPDWYALPTLLTGTMAFGFGLLLALDGEE